VGLQALDAQRHRAFENDDGDAQLDYDRQERAELGGVNKPQDIGSCQDAEDHQRCDAGHFQTLGNH